MMKGLTWTSIKAHPSLMPLYFFTVLGISISVAYPLRVAIKAPEISWCKHSNPEPWNAYANKQYKFFSPNVDYSKLESKAPRYWEIEEKPKRKNFLMMIIDYLLGRK